MCFKIDDNSPFALSLSLIRLEKEVEKARSKYMNGNGTILSPI